MFIKVNSTLYTAIIAGKMRDYDWNGRESKTITLTSTHAEVKALLPSGTSWSIVEQYEVPVLDGNGNPTGETTVQETEYDNSDFCISGDIIDHRDGTVTIKMGKITAEELLAIMTGNN